MKLGIISDIHVDLNHIADDPVEDAIIRVMLEKEPDMLLIAGDISNDYCKSLNTLHLLEDKTGIGCIFVPGNHDLWNVEYPKITDTNCIYGLLEDHPGNLCGHTAYLNNGYAVVGDTGWYDYTFGSGVFTEEQYEKGFHLERQWKDKDYISWGKSDIEKTQEMISNLADRINEVKGRKIILATHMVSHPAFLVPLPNTVWEYFNAFLGSSRFRKLFTPQVEHIVTGHVHFRKNHFERGRTFHCRCLGYRSEWQSNDAASEVRNAMEIVVLGEQNQATRHSARQSG